MIKKFAIIIISTIVWASCLSKDKNQLSDKLVREGAIIFKQNCEVCHGADGKLGANGSKDLTASVLDEATRIQIISKGKGLMAAYETLLTPDEIKAVTEFTRSLSK
jgi:cytochrome c6